MDNSTNRQEFSFHLPWNGSEKDAIEIEVIDSFLHNILLALVIANVITNLISQVQIHSAYFLD